MRAPKESIAAVGFVVMWSSGFIGARIGAAQASAITLLMWRFLVAAALLGGWWLLTRRRRLSARQLFTQVAIGLLSQCVYLYGVYESVQSGVSAGTSALIAALQPVAAAALAGPVLGQRTSGLQWAGLVLGLCGVGLVVSGDLHSGEAPLWGYLLSFLAMAGLVAATLLEQRSAKPTALADALPIHCLVSAIVFSTLAFGTGQVIPPLDPGFWAAIGWVVALSTVGGYGFYWINLRLGDINRVSSLVYLTPPVTMLWAFIMFGDTLGWFGLIGMAICAGAVIMVRRPGAVRKAQNRRSHFPIPPPISNHPCGTTPAIDSPRP